MKNYFTKRELAGMAKIVGMDKINKLYEPFKDVYIMRISLNLIQYPSRSLKPGTKVVDAWGNFCYVKSIDRHLIAYRRQTEVTVNYPSFGNATRTAENLFIYVVLIEPSNRVNSYINLELPEWKIINSAYYDLIPIPHGRTILPAKIELTRRGKTAIITEFPTIHFTGANGQPETLKIKLE